MSVPEMEVTLLSLTPETDYWITVAAVNTEGTGVSTNISAKPSGGIQLSIIIVSC